MRTILSCILVLGFFLCLGSGLVAEPKPTPKRISQLDDEFAGLTKTEIKDSLGSPVRASDRREHAFWYYNCAVIDDDTGKAYDQIRIFFQNGVVDAVVPHMSDDPN
ncbi:MAG: hypothetical protein MPJ25_16090 [Pirellulales bacterium]|nr:hypothetical protein [Pirellulales bacterium]